MGRQHLIDKSCGVCNRPFDVATEDLEWEHLKDCGETDEDSTMRDYSISQILPALTAEAKIMSWWLSRESRKWNLT